MPRPAIAVAMGCLLFALAACSRGTEPVAASRFVEPDRLFDKLAANVRSHPQFEVIADIDHARLAEAAGMPMPPSHVLIFSDPELEAAMLQLNPLAALDLPLRVLAFENQTSGKAAVIANNYDFLERRYGLPANAAIRSRYETAIAMATAGIPADSISRFTSDSIQDPGVVMLDSPYDFATTEQKILMAIDAQSDTVHFGKIDFAARSRAHGVELAPTLLILFGAPGPGGRAMARADPGTRRFLSKAPGLAGSEWHGTRDLQRPGCPCGAATGIRRHSTACNQSQVKTYFFRCPRAVTGHGTLAGSRNATSRHTQTAGLSAKSKESALTRSDPSGLLVPG